MKKLLALLPLAALMTTTHAGTTVVVTSGAETNYQSKAYAGLNWTLGGSTTPDLVLGAAYAKTKSNGRSNGADLSVSFGLTDGFKPHVAKLGYLNGTNDNQGEIAAGYSFSKNLPLIGVGVRVPYGTVSLDYLDSTLVPGATIHTLESFDKPNGKRQISTPI